MCCTQSRIAVCSQALLFVRRLRGIGHKQSQLAHPYLQFLAFKVDDYLFSCSITGILSGAPQKDRG